MEDVHLWMIDQHLGRRSLSDFQRGELALRKREITARRRAEAAQAPKAAEAATPEADTAPGPAASPAPDTNPLDTREALARAARLSPSQVAQIEKIQRQAAPEVVAAVKAGEISLSAAATVATLPVQEQVAAASGGKDELKQAAKRVREARRKPAAEPVEATEAAAMAEGEGQGVEPTEDILRERLADLVAENMVLRRRVAQLEAQLATQAGSPQVPPWEDLPASDPGA
jgi:hypothetical protein